MSSTIRGSLSLMPRLMMRSHSDLVAWAIRVAVVALSVLLYLEVPEDRVGQLEADIHFRRSRSLTRKRNQ